MSEPKIQNLNEALSDIGVPSALLMTTNNRSEWVLSNVVALTLDKWDRAESEGEDLEVLEALRALFAEMNDIINSLESKGYIIVEPKGRYGHDACLGDNGELVREASLDIDATMLIDYTPPQDMTEAEVDFALWGWNRLLIKGEVYNYYSPTAFGQQLELFHVIQCGVNGNTSTIPRMNAWDSFSGTMEEEDYTYTVFGAWLTCRCGVVDHLDVGDISVTSQPNFLPSMFREVADFKSRTRG